MAKSLADIEWEQAIKNTFPDGLRNIVMTPDSVKEEQEKLRRAIEEKREEEAQKMKKEQQQADALRAMAAQQNDAMRSQQYQGMQGMYGSTLGGIAGYGVASFASPLAYPSQNEARPKREAKPKAPEKTTEQAQEELTGIGRRKIIMDEGENNS